MLKAKIKMYCVPILYTRCFFCVIVLIQLIGSISESTTKSSLYLDFEEDERQLSGGGGVSSVNTKSFLRSHEESKHEQQEYTRNELQARQQPKQIDVIPISLEEENTRLIRNGGQDTSLEVQNDKLQHQNERQMLWLRKYILCVESDPNKWETITTRSRLVRAYYRGRGAVPGSCGDQCDTVCDHQPCFVDNKVGAGGFLCTCLEDAKPLCGANSKCAVNNQEEEVCTCKEGYTGNATTGCTDLNECSANICGTTSTSCTNTEGSYDCTCQDGYAYNKTKYGSGCVDFSECSAGTNPCGPNAKCSNSVGGFSCTCDTGYQGNPPSTQCTDVNECSANPTRCGADASVGTCVNTPGNFTCTCAAGYTWPNVNGPCTDINECTRTSQCGATESCVNIPGSFQCVCKSGFTGNPSAGQPCVDINECLDTVNPACGPNSQCTNTVGNFTCKCNSDFPGGNPPKEQCRKLIEREACPQGSTTLCTGGLECAGVSRSDTTNFQCCSEVEKCFTTQRCCNGSYDEGQPCPSGSNLDCSGDLVCERESVISARKICCNGASFVIGIGNICNLF